MMIGEKMLSLFYHKKTPTNQPTNQKPVSMTRHLQTDLLMPGLLLVISAVLFHFLFI